MKREDKERLGHMIDAIRIIRELDDGVRDLKTQLAVERTLEIIGEAANHVSKSIQALHPQIPWAQIISYRNKLIHAYFGNDENVLWDIVDNHLNELEHHIQAILDQKES